MTLRASGGVAAERAGGCDGLALRAACGLPGGARGARGSDALRRTWRLSGRAGERVRVDRTAVLQAGESSPTTRRSRVCQTSRVTCLRMLSSRLSAGRTSRRIDAHGAILAARDDRPSGMNAALLTLARVAAQHGQRRPGLRVPHARRAVVARGHDATAVGAVGDAGHDARVSRQAKRPLLARRAVPQPHVARAGDRDGVPVRAEHAVVERLLPRPVGGSRRQCVHLLVRANVEDRAPCRTAS